MRFHNQLDDIFSRGSKIKVLRYLFQENEEHTGRGIADAVGLSPSVAHSVLAELLGDGLVEVRTKGKAKLYQLRQGSYLVKKILQPLFEGERNLSEVLISDLKKGILGSKSEVCNVSIFGSVAAGTETERSDLDLLVVLKSSSGQEVVEDCIDKLAVVLAQKYKIALSPYIVTKRDLIKKRDRKLPLIKSILKNNRLVYGEPVEKILG